MEITEVRVFLREGQDKKLKAYTTVTLDDSFVVRNIKVIQGADGFFIAMPSRKMKFPCSKCGSRNETGSRFCNNCGQSIEVNELKEKNIDAKAEHRDIAHPITQKFREYLQIKVLEAYEKEASK
ncbi:MAG: septation protein SpoVG family protein [Candidatus Zapsychrus exili]|nr:septation protein SpoVG family protein [Candidatus Zapsychrus exili]